MAHKENKNKNKNKKQSSSELVNKESVSAVCLLFSVLSLIILFSKDLIFGELGGAVHGFLCGLFGYLAYPVFLWFLYLSVASLIGKKFIKKKKLITLIIINCILALLVAHTVQTAFVFGWGQEGYLTNCLSSGESFPKTSIAGWFGGLIVYGMVAIFSKIGALITMILLLLLSGFLTYRYFEKTGVKKEKVKKEKAVKTRKPLFSNLFKKKENVVDEMGVADAQQKGTQYQDSRVNLFNYSPRESYKKNLAFDSNSNVNTRPPVEISGDSEREYTPSYSEAYEDSVNEGGQVAPIKVVSEQRSNLSQSVEEPYYEEPVSESLPMQPIEPIKEEPTYPTFISEEKPTPSFRLEEFDETPSLEESSVSEEERSRSEYRSLFSRDNSNLFSRDMQRDSEELFSDRSGEEASLRTSDPFTENAEEVERSRDGLYLFDEKEEEDNPYALRSDFENEPTSPQSFDRDVADRGRSIEDNSWESESLDRGRGFETPASRFNDYVEEPAPTPPPKPQKPRVIKPYKRMSLDDFDCRDIEPTMNMEEIEETKQTIVETLEDFKVSGASIASVTFGPTVTRYNVTIPRNIHPRKVVDLDQSIAISLRSEGVNIYPNYEDGVVSMEVPNKERQFVQLGCMLSGDSYVNAKSSSLMFAMGKDVANRKIYGDISKMIHLLVAGASGSGKSVFLGALIVSLIHKYSPEELRLILIDPKKTEFVLYDNLPHLMVNEIITDVNRAVQSLNWAIDEMNRRYGLFEEMTRTKTYVVNLDQYNAQVEKIDRLPKIVIIIDELADLMLAAKKDMEEKIQNLTQKARAAGIHLIVATQRPSTDVITGVIKSNLPTRIAFGVATDVDSRVILDQTGAQNLLGKGDFLYTMQGVKTPIRVQSAFISPEESQKVVNFLKENNEAYYDESVMDYINKKGGSSSDGSSSSGFDKNNVEQVYIDALRYVISVGSASISMIQRKCAVGYNKAGKIVEWMEEMNYISSFDGARARKVLIAPEDFERIYGKY